LASNALLLRLGKVTGTKFRVMLLGLALFGVSAKIGGPFAKCCEDWTARMD